MNVRICSRKDAEALLNTGFPENTAVISFWDSPESKRREILPPVDYADRAARVFTVSVPDIDPEVLERYGYTYESYFAEAPALARFICRAKADGLELICQCEYGQSRSAACAAAILEHYEKNGISIFADYRYYPNQMIFNKLREALDREDPA